MKTKASKSKLEQTQKLDPIYCSHCRRFLGLERIRTGIIQLKCPQCKFWNTVEFDEGKI